MAEYMAYIGTYSKGENGGIFRAMIDSETGDLSRVWTSTDVENSPSASGACSGRQTPLRGPSETGEFRGRNGGATAACAVDAEGKLTFLNIVGTQGKHPCYVSVSPDGKFVYAANYSEGTATVFAVDENGALKDDPKIVVHQGTGANPRRQEKPHVHCTRITPDGKYLAVCDLGIDAVVLYPCAASAVWMQRAAALCARPRATAPATSNSPATESTPMS